jgi:hypothetical protein
MAFFSEITPAIIKDRKSGKFKATFQTTEKPL